MKPIVLAKVHSISLIRKQHLLFKNHKLKKCKLNITQDIATYLKHKIAIPSKQIIIYSGPPCSEVLPGLFPAQGITTYRNYKLSSFKK